MMRGRWRGYRAEESSEQRAEKGRELEGIEYIEVHVEYMQYDNSMDNN